MKERRIVYEEVYQPFVQQEITDKKVESSKRDGFNLKQKSERIIFSDNATVVFLDDGTKGVSKCSPTDTYNETNGIKIAYLRAKIKALTKELKELTR